MASTIMSPRIFIHNILFRNSLESMKGHASRSREACCDTNLGHVADQNKNQSFRCFHGVEIAFELAKRKTFKLRQNYLKILFVSISCMVFIYTHFHLK